MTLSCLTPGRPAFVPPRSPFACRFSSALPLSYSVTLDVSLAERSGLTFERELRSASDHPKQTLAYVASTRAG
jgi:hypothetical protein